MVVGITGGPGTGKSEVTERLRRRGAIVFSADEASRAVVPQGGRLLEEITAAFGSGVLARDGSLDRTALGLRIFADSGARARLNEIMHPAILRLLGAQIEAAKADMPEGSIIAVEIPLLFEASLTSWFELVVVVGASEATQIARLAARNGLDEDEARRRLDSQWPIAKKVEWADFVIWNEGSLSELDRAVDRLWEQLTQSEPNRRRN